MNTEDFLIIRHVDTVVRNNNPKIWLELETATEKRQCCYAWQGGWIWCDGDNEPPMSPELASAWEKADRIIQEVARDKGEATIRP